MPESGGCERHRTEPFVDYFNHSFGSKFTHRACLDRMYRDSKQPEALYSDAGRGVDLVIERKTVVWPLDYAAHHRNDHVLAEELSHELREVAANQPLSIRMSSAPRMQPDELRALAREIADSVCSKMPAFVGGGTVTSRSGDLDWKCSLDPYDRRADDEPETGLIVRWERSERFVSPGHLPRMLADHIRRLFKSTAEKFRSYPDAYGILLLDPYGAMRYSGEWWWSRVFEDVVIPDEVAEIWLSTYDWITDREQGWIFERLYASVHSRGSA